uniref:Uncharacterized protein n=1 Tax=viral metagenome TaxID=1070528 RepID=A0A6M3LR28_9ZZZZ
MNPNLAFDTSKPHLAFSLDTHEDEAAARFAKRYGQPPEFIFEEQGNLWVGPLPKREEHATVTD